MVDSLVLPIQIDEEGAIAKGEPIRSRDRVRGARNG